MKNSRIDTRTLTGLALFTAIVVVLQFLGSFVRFGPFSISLVLIPIVVGKMQEALAADTTTEEKTILTLEKVDGKWLITDLEENRPNAAAGSTEEAATAATTSTEYAAETEFTAEGSTSSEYAEEAATDGEYSE